MRMRTNMSNSQIKTPSLALVLVFGSLFLFLGVITGLGNNWLTINHVLAQQNGKNNTASSSATEAPLSKTGDISTHNSSEPFVADIVTLAKQNTNFREEIKTANHTQVVLMSLKPGEDIGMEVHKKIDQILVFVQGTGEAIIKGQKYPIREGTLAFVPADTPHNFINTGKTDLKLYTTYSPPNHYAGVLQKTKSDTKDYVPLGSIEVEG